MKKSLVAISAVILVIAFISILAVKSNSTGPIKLNINDKFTLLKSMSCGCCSVYETYMQKNGIQPEVPEISDEQLTAMKDKYGIPSNLRSCHTTIVGNYFVEGHIPLEAVQKMLYEKPDIKGIAMPGMPSGSPGMPGSKEGLFIIYAIDKEGGATEFMRI